MIDDEREAAVEHLSGLLERDVISIEVFRATVERLLATSSPDELALVLADIPAPATASEPPLVIHCRSGVVREVPTRLPEAVEIRCDSGVLKVDLSRAELDHAVTDVDIDVDTGVVKVVVHRDVHVEIAEHIAGGGVFKNAVRVLPADSWRPTLLVHVRNQGGVLKLQRTRRRR